MPIFNLWTHSMCPYKFYYSSCSALGIGAASFASHAGRGAGTGMGTGIGDWGRGGDGASKDIAESPTACRNAKIC